MATLYGISTPLKLRTGPYYSSRLIVQNQSYDNVSGGYPQSWIDYIASHNLASLVNAAPNNTITTIMTTGNGHTIDVQKTRTYLALYIDGVMYCSYTNISGYYLTANCLTFDVVIFKCVGGTYDGNYGLGFFQDWENMGKSFSLSWDNSRQTELINLIADNLIEDPYDIIPHSDDGGGFGNGEYENDDTDYTNLPTLSSSQVGFCSLYKMTQQQMTDLADYLWGLSQGTVATFLPIFSNPMDCIIAVGIVPVSPKIEQNPDLIKVGNLITTVYGHKITHQYDFLDMGEVEIGKGEFTNSFMDYSPYTKVELFLPYIGTVALDTDEVMDSTVGVSYNFDLLSGSCVAEVRVKKTYNYQDADHLNTNVLYRYSGNFLANIPINGENFAQMFSAVIGAVAMGINAAGSYKTGIASAEGAKSASIGEARSDAASLHRSAAAFNGVGATAAMKPSVQRAGNISSVCGFLSKQKPEIIIKAPKIANIGKNQGHEVGYPRYGEYNISDLEGYTSIMMIHLKNIPCTDDERNMIESDLNNGVIFSQTAVPVQSYADNVVAVYKFKCENICANKADDWELIGTANVEWREPSIDVLHPIIILEPSTDITKAKIIKEGNYVYIAAFDRYYYVKGIKALSGTRIEVELSVDACMSWLTNLKLQKCVVDRQEKEWNLYLNDEYMRVYNTPYTVVKEFPSGFDTSNFILAVAGGGSTSSNSGDDDGGGGGHDF